MQRVTGTRAEHRVQNLLKTGLLSTGLTHPWMMICTAPNEVTPAFLK
jgi:hypothetical protein